MRNLFEPDAVREVRARLLKLRPESERQWGTMSPAQAVAHCSGGMEMALGDIRPRRALIGLLLGWAVKRLAFRDDEPMRLNSPTVPEMVVADARSLDDERRRLEGLIDRFTAAGPAGCTTHPHAFFGRLDPHQWAVLMYKHLDHHLRQFGV